MDYVSSVTLVGKVRTALQPNIKFESDDEPSPARRIKKIKPSPCSVSHPNYSYNIVPIMVYVAS
jgi:hypothetical protein